jgi:hypothetical protein
VRRQGLSNTNMLVIGGIGLVAFLAWSAQDQVKTGEEAVAKVFDTAVSSTAAVWDESTGMFKTLYTDATGAVSAVYTDLSGAVKAVWTEWKTWVF